MRSRAFVVIAALTGALVSGGWLLQRGSQTTAGATDRAQLFDEVFRHVSRFYVDTLQSGELYQKAVEGMLENLNDPHSAFLNPERLRRLTEGTTGRYAGLGIQIEPRDGWIVVVAPLPGTPAERAGILTGDRIVEIEGRSTRSWTSDEALRALRGQPGTRVSFVIDRPGAETRLPFSLTRREIQVSSVRRASLISDDVGVVEFRVFSENTADEVASAVDSLHGAGMRLLILDMRSNPGGLLDQGVGVSELFLDRGQKVVSMRGRTRDANRDYLDRTPQRWPTLPMIVLVDSGSASASEIVAGALQDHDRAVVLGTTTFGKGSAQSLFAMPGGGALKLTTALWYTPIGRSINRPIQPADSIDDGDGPDAKTESFRTQGGRVVYGGGGITPDLIVGARPPTEAEIEFQRALGRHVPQFFDALTSYAIDLRAQRTVRSPQFEVTPAMLEELWRRMEERGIRMDRRAFDAASESLSRQLGIEIARYVFGGDAEFQRWARHDAVIQRALELAVGIATQRELFDRADENRDPTERRSASRR
ncbi:MAG TPA: S41 family peptidase [Gemmatimonadaceae bacterium]|nr:S41 family peptidase [Gemmatimonadaceae bacterium]